MNRIRAGGPPPTECPSQTAGIDADYRRFERGVIKAYAIAIVVVITAIAYFS